MRWAASRQPSQLWQCRSHAAPPPTSHTGAEVASEEGKVELPLCAECAAEVHKELEGQLAELQQVWRPYPATSYSRTVWRSIIATWANMPEVLGKPSALHGSPSCHPRSSCSSLPMVPAQEVAAYEAALERLEAEGLHPLDDRTFQQQLGAAQAEVAGER